MRSTPDAVSARSPARSGRAAPGPARGQLRIGISGWRYEGWRGAFYPAGWPQKRELDYASRAVQTIEINGTHYSLQSPESFRRWYDETPDDFVFSVKGSRYLTHMLRFEGETAVLACANFFAQGLLALDEKLGPILWQFPPRYTFEPERFERFLAQLPRDTEAALRLAGRHDGRIRQPYLAIDRRRPLRHAIEIRHASFLVPEFVALLRRYGAALVVSDSTQPWPHVEDVTADFVYLRLHGTEGKYAGAYGDDALEHWASRLREWRHGGQPADAQLIAPDALPRRRASRDVFCYFDNDQKSEAPFDARRLMARFGIRRDAAALAAPDGPRGNGRCAKR